MGQKFSHLRGIFGGLDNIESPNQSVNGPIEMSLNDANDIYDHSNDGTDIEGPSNLPRRSPTVEQLRNNGNSRTTEMTDNIFEDIYSNGSEIAKSLEENGNTVTTEASTSGYAGNLSCKCPRKLEHCVCDQAIGSKMKNVSTSLQNVDDVGASYFKEESTRTSSLVSSKRPRAKSLRSSKEAETGSKKKRNHWVLKFNCARLKSGSSCGGAGVGTDIPEPNLGCNSCVCTGYRRTEEHHLGAGVVFEAASNEQSHQINYNASSESSSSSEDVPEPPPPPPTPPPPAPRTPQLRSALFDYTHFNPEAYPIEDCDERARLERAREIAEGVDPPPGFCPGQHIQLICPPALTLDNLTALFQTHLGIHSAALSALSQIDVTLAPAVHRGVHTQVDYIHCLVPDILQITSCSFYWGKMDRYEAERLLEGRPEGTFLLRDSAQEEYLFSVSFRKYGRSLHARIEQWNHHFSFDSHDPGVYASPTVCGLIEHYKDPSCCMFFEPMLTIPLHRNFPFPLQHLCRAAICSKATYDGVNQLQLPKPLKGYLKEYHYKQRVRVRIFDFEP